MIGKGRLLKAILLILSLLPLLLFAYMAQFNRLINDDYIYLAVGRDLGPWGAMLHWRGAWNGSYADHLVFGLMAPFGADAPRVFSTLLFLLWLSGLAWLMERLLAKLYVERHRRSMALGAAALTLAATFNAFPSQQSLFYFSATVRYNLPLALLAVYLALVLAAASRGYRGPRLEITAAIGFAICSFAGGLSEMHMVIQLCLIACLLVLATRFAARSAPRAYQVLIGAGLAATIVSLLIQISAPGVIVRSTYISDVQGVSNPTLPEWATRFTEALVWLITAENTFAGFFMLFGIGLFAALLLGRMPRAVALRGRPELARAPLICGLFTQLAFLPILWAHTSDQLSVLGRFSFAYSSVVVLNLGLLCLFLLLLWRGRGISALIFKSRNGPLMLSSGVLLLILALVFAVHFRSIHHRAMHYLVVTSLLLIGMLAWQLQRTLGDEQTKRYGLAALLMTLATAATYLIQLGVPLFTIGRIVPRVTVLAALLHVLLGLALGAYVGYLIRRAGATTLVHKRWLRRIGLSGLAVAGVIGAGIMLGQARFIPDLQTYAREWDAREQLIISQRDSGQMDVVVAPLSFDLSWHILYTRMSRPMESGSAAKYYGVDSISVDTDEP